MEVVPRAAPIESWQPGVAEKVESKVPLLIEPCIRAPFLRERGASPWSHPVTDHFAAVPPAGPASRLEQSQVRFMATPLAHEVPKASR